MRTLLNLALRMLAVVAVLATLQISSGVVGPIDTPYTSSLSHLTGGEVYAAGCAMRSCRFLGERPHCVSSTLFTKCAQKGTECAETPC